MKKFWTFLICFELVSGQWAHANSTARQAVDLAELNLAGFQAFLSSATSCYQRLGPLRYREIFCEQNQSELQGYQALTVSLEAEKEVFQQKWKDFYDGKVSPPRQLRPLIESVKKEVEKCEKDEAFYASEGEGGEYEEGSEEGTEEYSDYETEEPAPEVEAEVNADGPPLIRPRPRPRPAAEVFLGTQMETGISLNPEIFNGDLSQIAASLTVLNKPEDQARLRRYLERASELRRRVFLANPQLLTVMITEMSGHYGSDELFWYEVERSTGISPRDIPADVRENYNLLQTYRRAFTDPDQPAANDNSLLQLQETTPGNYTVEYTEYHEAPGLDFEAVKRRTGWTAEEYSRNFRRLYMDEDIVRGHEITQSLIIEAFKPVENEVRALAKEKEEIYNIVSEIFSQYPEDQEFDYGDDGEYVDESYCEFVKSQRLMKLSNEHFMVDFYSNEQNKKFMRDQFTEAQGLMKETLDGLDMSAGSKEALKAHLDQVQFDLPEMSEGNWLSMHKEVEKVIDVGLEFDSTLSYDELRSLAQGHLRRDPRYRDLNRLDDYDGVNAYYMPDVEGPHNAHHVSATCGLAQHKVQKDSPEVFFLIMAHELGHALDPSFSDNTLSKFSPPSRAQMDDLRQCLIRQNSGTYPKINEDFADHFQSHLMAKWMKKKEKDADWPLMRLRLLKFHYSNLCEDDGSFTDSHSNNHYRFNHLFSHPEIAPDFTEMAPPPLNFCPQLLPKAGVSR